MKVKLETKALDDGRIRPVVMYREHWWSSWKPLLDDEGNLVVHWGFLSEEEEGAAKYAKRLVRCSPYSEEGTKARLSMFEMIAWSDDVYVGAKNCGKYHVAYDAPNVGVDDLQNLEIEE